MAALAILLRHGRRSHAHGIPLSRALSTTTAGTDPGALSVTDAKRRLRREHDPDRAVSILEAIDMASLSAASTRLALSLAARRLSRSRRFAEAEALLSSHLPAATTEPHLAAVLCSYASADLPEKALDAFRSAAPSLPTPISSLPFNALLSAFLRCRCHHRVPKKTEEAEHLWKEMLESGCKPDVATYNVKAMNYGLHGKPEEVLEVMREMEEAGVKPDTITYNFLMTSYCRNGKLEDAKVLYHSLAEKGCSANAATFKHMLAAMCAHGDFDAGLGIFKESLKRRKVPDFRTMKGLVEGLAKGGRVAEAKNVIAEMKKRFAETLLLGWKKLEKELGLDLDSIDTPQSKGTSGETVGESKSVAADTEALELEGSAVEETAAAEKSSDDEAPAPE
ncbi:Pentatricopeptide repeat-containing protein, partial [Dichanthelium oligosanthes]